LKSWAVFIKQSVIQGMIDILHDEINLMRRTPDAHEFGLKLVLLHKRVA
jgi:hypothetical protein